MLVRTGQTLLVSVLAGYAVVALVTGQIGWRNYWGGLVSPTIALVIAFLFALVVIKRRRSSGRRSNRTSV